MLVRFIVAVSVIIVAGTAIGVSIGYTAAVYTITLDTVLRVYDAGR